MHYLNSDKVIIYLIDCEKNEFYNFDGNLILFLDDGDKVTYPMTGIAEK